MGPIISHPDEQPKKVVVRQDKYSERLKVTVYQAFAEVKIEFRTDGGDQAEVVLDIESAVAVISAMDDKEAARKLRRLERLGEPEKKPWWRFWE